MTQQSLLHEDWQATVERLGGAVVLKESARKTKAFLRGREFEDAIAMLRMIPAFARTSLGLLPGRRRLAIHGGMGCLGWARRSPPSRGQAWPTLPCFTACAKAGIGLPGW